MKNFRSLGKIGEWAIYYYRPPYPAGFAQIKYVNKDNYELDTVHLFMSMWDKNYCSTFETKEECEKEYDNE